MTARKARGRRGRRARDAIEHVEHKALRARKRLGHVIWQVNKENIYKVIFHCFCLYTLWLV